MRTQLARRRSPGKHAGFHKCTLATSPTADRLKPTASTECRARRCNHLAAYDAGPQGDLNSHAQNSQIRTQRRSSTSARTASMTGSVADRAQPPADTAAPDARRQTSAADAGRRRISAGNLLGASVSAPPSACRRCDHQVVAADARITQPRSPNSGSPSPDHPLSPVRLSPSRAANAASQSRPSNSRDGCITAGSKSSRQRALTLNLSGSARGT
jgi:hypothetical protein